MARRKSQKQTVRKKANEYNSADTLETFADRIYQMLPPSTKAALDKAIEKRAMEVHVARPRKTVDEAKIIELASKGHTLKGIAALCGISYDTLHRRFAASCEKGEELCNDALRVKQIERALAGSDTMLIWLGKQRLNQRDKQEVTGADGGPIVTTVHTIRFGNGNSDTGSNKS